LEPSQELFLEFDEFLVQVKSTLDHLVKVPMVFLGKNRWSLNTFGDKGDSVIKALSHNLPSSQKKFSSQLISTVKKHQGWLRDTIIARDKINHFIDGGINFEYFIVICVEENKETQLKVPLWSSEQTIRDFMGVIWNNLFCFCEDFVVLFYGIRLKKEYAFFHGKSVINSIESPWKITSYQTMQEVVSHPGWERLE
jgi:hypothetical protein